jgi:hypothetical protein
VDTRSKAWVCGRSLAGSADSNTARGHVPLSLMTVVCCQVEMSFFNKYIYFPEMLQSTLIIIQLFLLPIYMRLLRISSNGNAYV